MTISNFKFQIGRAGCSVQVCSRLTTLLLIVLPSVTPARAADLPSVRVSADQRGFELAPGGQRFTPWGFNYDHDETGRLIEDYWLTEWPKVEEDFREMKSLGANVVRIHLQFGKFVPKQNAPDEISLKQLERLVKLAEQVGIYLDLTGLACYHKADVPAWYDNLSEADRWAAQATFWEAIASRCKDSPAIFCYDLMNEPVSPAGMRKEKEWLGPPFAGKHFVQMISLDQRGRPRPEIAREWIHGLVQAIRKHDRKHLVTVGLVDWSLDRPGLTSGFVPDKVAADLDFLCIHLYPHKGKLAEARETLKGFAIGKPVVIEETFVLHCGFPEFGEFIEQSRETASGWIGFYWGKTPDELRKANTIGDAIMLGWLEYFQRHAPK